MRDVVLVVHNVRSAHNVGSLLRTAEGLAVSKVWLTGYTPYPKAKNDSRLPHLAQKIDRRIHKTALGAEQWVTWSHSEELDAIVKRLKKDGYRLVALEQSAGSLPLKQFKPPAKTALLVGSETAGLDKRTLNQCDFIVEIPMRGRKESFNVAAAAAMALYHLSSLDKTNR